MVHGQGEQVGIGDLGRVQQAIRTQHAWGQQAEAIGLEAMARQASPAFKQRGHHGRRPGTLG
jgi:hypothetical protein